jgi:transcriptional regulator with XRE-family HTH domain
MAATHRTIATMNSQDESFFKELGTRIARARKDQGMTQVQLAERLGIAQQTLAHYEVGRVRMAASLLPTIADILDRSLDELLLGEPAMRKASKRGPASRLQQQIDAVAQLPKSEQRFVSKMLDNLLAQHQGQESANAA